MKADNTQKVLSSKHLLWNLYSKEKNLYIDFSSSHLIDLFLCISVGN